MAPYSMRGKNISSGFIVILLLFIVVPIIYLVLDRRCHVCEVAVPPNYKDFSRTFGKYIHHGILNNTNGSEVFKEYEHFTWTKAPSNNIVKQRQEQKRKERMAIMRSSALNRSKCQDIDIKSVHEGPLRRGLADNRVLTEYRHGRTLVFHDFTGKFANYVRQMFGMYYIAYLSDHVFITTDHKYLKWLPDLDVNIVSKELYNKLRSETGADKTTLYVPYTLKNYNQIVLRPDGTESGQLPYSPKPLIAAANYIQNTHAVVNDQLFDIFLMNYFDAANISLRHVLDFSDHVRKVASQFWECILINDVMPWAKSRNITVGDVTLVAFHNRRGDYARTKHAATPEKALAAMEFFENRHPYVFFIICTDDITWTEVNILPHKRNGVIASKFAPPKEPQIDLAVMAKCDHAICSSYSSFGEMAAYMVGGETVQVKANNLDRAPMTEYVLGVL